MKFMTLVSIFLATAIGHAADSSSEAATRSSSKINVAASFYSLGYALSPGGDHGAFFRVRDIDAKTRLVTITGDRAQMKNKIISMDKALEKANCLQFSPKIELKLTDLGNGHTQFEVLSASMNGKDVAKAGFKLWHFGVAALEPKGSDLQSLAINLRYDTEEDDEDSMDFRFTLSPLAATIYTRDGDDDAGKIFEAVSLQGRYDGKKMIYNVKGVCY